MKEVSEKYLEKAELFFSNLDNPTLKLYLENNEVILNETHAKILFELVNIAWCEFNAQKAIVAFNSIFQNQIMVEIYEITSFESSKRDRKKLNDRKRFDPRNQSPI